MVGLPAKGIADPEGSQRGENRPGVWRTHTYSSNGADWEVWCPNLELLGVNDHRSWMYGKPGWQVWCVANCPDTVLCPLSWTHWIPLGTQCSPAISGVDPTEVLSLSLLLYLESWFLSRQSLRVALDWAMFFQPPLSQVLALQCWYWWDLWRHVTLDGFILFETHV